MSSNQNEDSDLAEGWILCTSKSKTGRKYYFNRKTGKSSWTKPEKEEATTSTNAQKRKKESEKIVKKQDIPKKGVKRKSEGDMNLNNKKRKDESSPNKNKHIPLKRSNRGKQKLSLSPNKRLNVTKDKQTPSLSKSASSSRSSIEQTPRSTTKNLANNRLSQLRAELAEEVKNEKNQRRKSAPSNLEKESKLNESQTSQSSNDSLHSIPSPSQFLAANKIISSMKAQLPDEHCSERQKDTFADIEQGICNQSSDFIMKPPLTPPQFSEASKLMSAINSKLCYKSKESMKSPAMERLESLRAELSSAMEGDIEQSTSEAMDIDVKTIPLPAPLSKSSTNAVQMNTQTSSSNDKVVLVVDTNVFIHQLDVIQNIMNSHIQGYKEQPTLLVPWRVINELDRLKDNNNGYGALSKRARPAMDYLYKNLPENERIKVQPLRDANSHIYPCESPDDEILNCCLQQAERGNAVILVSNDKNLCSKARSNDITSSAASELRLERRRASHAPHAPHAHARRIRTLLANILENEMRAKYDKLWLHVILKPPPWTLAEVLLCLNKHWLAVFSEVFPRIEHLITELKNSWAHIENKDPSTLTESQVCNFKELCLDIARRCQIIPEYMELARRTVARLQTQTDSDTDDETSDKSVVEAFERVWTVYSSYCAKLASELHLVHNLEDRLSVVDPIEVLSGKLPEFSSKIKALTEAMDCVLNTSNERRNVSVCKLEAALKDSMTCIGMDAALVNNENITLFTSNCRNMLEEAWVKFSQLVGILEQCKCRLRCC